jgi:cytochrome b involved in lipid metabolism
MMSIYKHFPTSFLVVPYFLIAIGVLGILGSFGNISMAAGAYTAADVQKHNTVADCWMSYNGKVYDITDYLKSHDAEYYFIDSWCGTDMTQAYNTKDGAGVNHKSSTTTGILPSYYIGDLVIATPTAQSPTATPVQITTSTNQAQISPTPTITTSPNVTSKVPVNNPYDFWTPFLIVNILLWGNYFLSKTAFWKSKFKALTYNMIWNSMLIISLVPSVVFGLFLILSYSFPALRKIDFDFLYWHVEGSICFTVIALAHLLLRLKIYFMQLKISLSKPKTI